MRRPVSSNKALLAIAVVLSLLVTTTVYACSGLSLFQMDAQHSSMGDEGVKRGPCAEHKQDICRSVRDRMRSTQPAAFKAPDAQPLWGFPSPLVFESFEEMVLPPYPFDLETFYHPVFKLSLPFSFRVLRI